MSQARSNVYKLRDVINVKDPAFGARGDNATDDTAALRLVNSTKAAGRYKAWFPTGNYLVTDEVQWNPDRVNLEGEGQQATVIEFQPTAGNKKCFHFTKTTAATVGQCSLRGFGFNAGGNTQAGKVAITITDGEEIVLDDFAVSNWSSAGKDCIGLQLRGRQAHSISNYVIFADLPISIEDNPNHSIDIDHYHFWNGYTVAADTQPHVKIADGVNLTHVTFDGYQAWALGKHGIYWNDTTTAGVSVALRIENVRWEQQPDPTGYFFWIVHNINLDQLQIRNCYGGLSANFLHLRKTIDVTLDNLFYPGSGVAIDADNTCTSIDFNNVHFNDSASTVTLSATNLSGQYFTGGNITSLSPAAAAGAVLVQKWNPSATQGFMQLEPAKFAVAAGVITRFCTTAMHGMFMIYTNNSRVSALMAVNGSALSTRELVESDAGWFGTAVGASNYNIYYDGGSGEYKIQNNTGSDEVFTVVAMVGQGER